MRTRTHRVTLTVRFDRPCSRAWAVSAVRDEIHGEFYPVVYVSHFDRPGWTPEPETFRVLGARSADQKPRRKK